MSRAFVFLIIFPDPFKHFSTILRSVFSHLNADQKAAEPTAAGCSEVLAACGRLRSLGRRLFGDSGGTSATAGPFWAQLLRRRRSFPPSPEAKCYKHERVTFSTLPTYFPAICGSSSSRPVIATAAALLLTAAAAARLPRRLVFVALCGMFVHYPLAE